MGTNLVDTLLHLGDRARVRYWDTDWTEATATGEYVTQVYAVTYDTDRGPRSFFVRLTLQKSFLRGSPYAYWKVEKDQGGVRPSGWVDPPTAGSGQG